MKSHVTTLLSGALRALDLPEVDFVVTRPDDPRLGDYASNVAFLVAAQGGLRPRDVAEKIVQEVRDHVEAEDQPWLKTVEAAGAGFINFRLAEAGIIRVIDQLLRLENVDVSGKISTKTGKSKVKKSPLGLTIYNNIHACMAGNSSETGTKPKKVGKDNGYSASKAVSLINDAAKARQHVTDSRDNSESLITDRYDKPEKIIAEFTDPNPFKELHIGHLYSNAVGESLSRLYEALGHDVTRACYQGDVGMHVAKSVWGMQKQLQERATASGGTIKDELAVVGTSSLEERVKFLGAAYARGAAAYTDEPSAADEIKTLNYYVYMAAQRLMTEKTEWQPQVDYSRFITADPDIFEMVYALYTAGREWSLAHFEVMYRRLGTKFDRYYFESMVGESGYTIVNDHIADGVFEQSDGAIVYRGEKHGLHTRVFINSLGLPTYEAKELGLAPAKYADKPYDRSVIVTANEIDEYFKVLLSALGEVSPDLAAKTTHISHGIVKLPEGKMSSRTGNIITAQWLLETAKTTVLHILDASDRGYSPSQKEEIAETAAVAAVKYSLLRVGVGSDITFDVDASVAFEGDSGPYLLYTYARCRSILSNAGTVSEMLQKQSGWENMSDEERSVLRLVFFFPEIVIESARSMAPSGVATYLYTLATAYNAMYATHSILGADVNADSRWLRIFITRATAETLRAGLWVLGIPTVEKM